jgi:hypothetical protein
MVMSRHVQWMAICLVTLAFGSCNDTVNSGSDAQTNTPIVANTLDAFTFTVNASHLNFNLADSLSFSGTPVVRSLVVTDYGSGAGYIIIEGSASTVLLSDTLSGNRIIAGTEYSASAPTHVAIALTDYSGKVTFALARK